MKTGTTIGTLEADKLIIDGKHDLDVKGVTINFAAAGTLSRGSLLAINESTGKAELVKDTETTTGEGEDAVTATSHQTPDCILCDDIEATGSGDIYTSAYKSGNFAKNKLEEVTGITLTDSDIEALRIKGIFVESVVE